MSLLRFRLSPHSRGSVFPSGGVKDSTAGHRWTQFLSSNCSCHMSLQLLKIKGEAILSDIKGKLLNLNLNLNLNLLNCWPGGGGKFYLVFVPHVQMVMSCH
jgi:hypothetical protein